MNNGMSPVTDEPDQHFSSPARNPPNWGSPLTEADYRSLASSWVDRLTADAAMLRRVDSCDGRAITGRRERIDCAGILFPYYWSDEPLPFSYRLRRDKPDYKLGQNGRPKPDRKYLGAFGSGNRLYLAPDITANQLSDTSVPVALTEGEKKCLALSRLANWNTAEPRFVSIAIPGVWNWRGKVGKGNGPNGERIDLKGPIPDLARLAWAGRIVFIVFDSNVRTNESVSAARAGLTRDLVKRGATVKLVDVPEPFGVNGIDDLLALWGPERVLELFRNATTGPRLQVIQPPQFEEGPEGIFRINATGERITRTQLSNFKASIAANATVDDGVELRREFDVIAELDGQQATFTISAGKFARMEWPIEQLGSRAIIFPNQREYARVAIQSLSLATEQRHVFAHTGWRKIGATWVFIHRTGGIGQNGSVPNISVRLTGAVNNYELRVPQDVNTLLSAVAASLRLLELAPPHIAFSLFAGMVRAVFGEADFALHVTGETGAFKSELAALYQQHFGATMTRLNLPAAWASTGNALEATAFQAKDTLFVIDDFAPHGSGTEVSRYHSEAERVIRAVGNAAGRARLDSSATLKPAKPPRALILSTGEDVPRGHSVRARLLVLELGKGCINTAPLTQCQADGANGRYAETMGGFVQWLAGDFEAKKARLLELVAVYRSRALGSAVHARTPNIVANLGAAFELFLDFAVDVKALSKSEQEYLLDSCWAALSEAAAQQSKHQIATEPTLRFVDLIRSVLTSGRAHVRLISRRGASDCSRQPLQGECIGWVTHDSVFLQPETAFRVAQIAARDAGEALAVSQTTLRKRLHEKDLLASVDETRNTLTVRRTFDGVSHNVLHFSRTVLLPETAGVQSDGGYRDE